MDQSAKADLLRRLHEGPSILVLANAWDAASARLVEDAGFPAVATTSAGVANSLGYPDGQHVPFEEMLFVIRRITGSVAVPVTADIESGFGKSVEEVTETVRAVIEAGAVGINLEDSTKGQNPQLLPIAEQAARIQAVRELGQSMGVPLVINARTDAFIPAFHTDRPLEVSIERLDAYLEAGADCAFPILAKGPDTIAALVAAVNGPVNIIAVPGVPPVPELERLGVRRVSMGSGICRASMALTRRIANELRASGTYRSFMDEMMTAAEANGLFAR